jgi:hypothetical protein
MQRFCDELEIRVDRPAYRSLRGDPDTRAGLPHGWRAPG